LDLPPPPTGSKFGRILEENSKSDENLEEALDKYRDKFEAKF
jgi:hypothetical protein